MADPNHHVQLEASPLLDVQEVARMLGCSTRHVCRLADTGRMPSPLRLGALVRWSRQSLVERIATGCPAVTQA